MNRWLGDLKYDPLAPLLECGNTAIQTFVRCDLLDKVISVKDLWQLAEPQKILLKQKSNGSWAYPSAKDTIRTQENYNQIETYRNFGVLVEKFGFNKEYPAISKAAEYLFSFQSNEGDFRGIYGNQYSPNYSAGITELLVKAGYGNDTRIKKVFEWLLSIRQEDAGWAIPFRTRDRNLDVITKEPETLEPDRSQPFSYMVTGVVLRAFAAHPSYRKAKEARQAGNLLLSMIFKKDHYPDRAGAEYWLRFSFPFWFTDLISALDTLSLLGFSAQEPQIEKALQWFVKNQQKTGLWQFKILKGKNKDILELWLALAVCRIFKRFYS
jgi:Squalene-hopene cyclase C-terminal domain